MHPFKRDRLEAAYRYIESLSPEMIAFEFLRRNDRYRDDYALAERDQRDPVGCLASPRSGPALGVTISWKIQTRRAWKLPSSGAPTSWLAMSVWRPHLKVWRPPALILRAERWGGRQAGRFTPDGYHLIVTPARGIEHHLIFGDSGPPPHGRALMPLPSFDAWHPERLTATLAFWRFAQNPRSSPAAPVKLPKPSAKTLESAFLIWALDLDRAGSSARDIARALFDEAPPDWEDSSSRSRIRRLLRKAEAMSAGKYRLLLKPGDRA